MNAQRVRKPSIECTRVIPTRERPGSEGTYIVRLSPANQRRLKVRNGAYLKVSYGQASVTTCLSVDDDLDDTTIRIDQTLRTAICLEMMMQGTGKKELVYSPDGNGDLSHPIVIQGSNFRGPSLLDKLLKQQYLICAVHHAMPGDMEKPIVRLMTNSMADIGIQPGDKVLLITEKGSKGMRCLALDPDCKLPFETMHTTYTDWPCPDPENRFLRLPWITLDLQTRLALGVQPWEPIIVGRYLPQVLTSEFREVALVVALGAVGGAIVIPKDVNFLLPLAFIIAGLAAVATLIWLKIRSKL